jgi:hypothetical protein
VVQLRRGGHREVFAADGVVRRWAVRGASGDLALQIVRPTGRGRYAGTATSRTERVTSPGVHVFTTDLAARRGDLVGLLVRPGAGVGIVPGAGGAATLRFTSPLRAGFAARPPEQGAGSGFDRAVELRVEYEPRHA